MAWNIMGALSGAKYDKQYSEKEIIRRLIPYLANHKKYTFFVIAFSIISALISILGPIALAISVDELFKPVGNIVFNIVMISALTYLSLLALEWLFTYVSTVNSRKLQSYLTYDLRLNLFARINKHELAFYDQNKTGKIMSRVSGDTFQLGGVLTTIVDLGSVIVRAGLILGTMLVINWQLTFLALLIFPILFFIVYFFRNVFRRFSLLQRRVEASVNAFVEEQINGIQITKSFGRSQYVMDAFDKLQEKKVKVNIRQATLFRVVGPLFELLTALGLALLLIGGGNAILNNSLTPGLLYLFITYLRQLFQPLITLSTFYATLQGGFAAGERIFSLIDVPVSIVAGTIACPPLEGKIEFKDVTFTYNKEQKPLFMNLNLEIPAGQTLAIVGETGAGKTSLASLLARFYEYSGGSIILDNQYNLKEIEADSLRDQIGYVLQEPFLFSGTIRDNLLLGSPAAKDDDINQALKAVGADSFIKLLPRGIQTPIKERGRGLSTGQRQLLSLARVLLKNPRILILDEATASVDAYTEHMIQEALKTVFKGRTTIVIAHRLSTILNADRIIVMSKGTIIDEGTHTELINKEGKYRDLYFTYYAHQGILNELTIEEAPQVVTIQ